MNSFKQIDFVLSYLKERSELSADFAKENIWNYIRQTPEIGINKQIFDEILQRLVDDGYIKETIREKTQPIYHLTFNGRIFEGYLNRNISLNQEREWLKHLQILTLNNSNKLNLITWIIAIGTLIAAIYYILEILNHCYAIYPVKK